MLQKPLTPKRKNWLLYNIKRFHSEDQYLKYLNNKIILADLKQKINESFSEEELLGKLTDNSYTNDFSFYRKDGKLFCYPSLRNQIESLLDCWDELREVYKNIYLGNEDEYEQLDDEPFSEQKEISAAKIKRNTFGNKLNIHSVPHLKEQASLFKHLMCSNKYIKGSFTFEYHYFKKRCLKELTKIEGKTTNSYFFQTDIKSFFHDLKPATILLLIKKYNLVKLEEWISKLVTDGDGLPIGWMLSGLISDLVMIEFSKHINRNHQSISTDLKIIKFEMISYVDDLVFFIDVKDRLSNKADFLQLMCKKLQASMNNFFIGSSINIHPYDSHKVKFIELDKGLASVLKTNWHDVDIVVSGEDFDSSRDWSILDDFLLPSDNDLILNEKVQFFNNLRNLKSRVLNNEINSVEKFLPYLDKIFYKISISKKYLSTAFDVVFTFLQDRSISEQSEVVRSVWNKFKIIDDVCTVDIIQFLKRYNQHCCENENDNGLLLEIVNEVIGFVATEGRFALTDDNVLLSSYLQIDFLKHLKDLTLNVPLKGNYYFYTQALKYVDYSQRLIESDDIKTLRNANPFLSSEVIQLNVKGKVKTSNQLIKYVRAFSLGIKKIKSRKDFIQVLFDDISSDYLSFMNKKSLGEILDFLNENDINSKLAVELRGIYKNYDKMFDYFLQSNNEGFNNYVGTLKRDPYVYQRPKILNFEVLKNKGKEYVYYKDIVTCILFSMPTISDVLRFVLFQYRPIDSVIFVSWKALPLYFNATSSFSLALTKDFFRTTVNEFILHKELEIIPFSVPEDLKKRILGKEFYGHIQARVTTDKNRLELIKLDFFDKLIAGEKELSERFKKNKINLMISNLEVNIKTDFNSENNCRLSVKAKLKLHAQIMKALKEAVLRNCDIICFPELTMPLDWLNRYLDFCGKHSLILIGGTEYIDINSQSVVNPSIISFPTDPKVNPLSKSYHAFIQFKNYISIKEIDEFAKISKERGEEVKVIEGKEILIFDDINAHRFSILSCSDFLSLELKFLLQGEVQTVFVPSMNFDNTTYFHVAQAAIRELYCICIICNNSYMGASMVCAPYRDEHKRMMFKIEGTSYPKCHYLSINPSIILELQNMASDKSLSFENNKAKLISDSVELIKTYKQPPPDWHFLIKNKKKLV